MIFKHLSISKGIKENDIYNFVEKYEEQYIGFFEQAIEDAFFLRFR